MTAESLKSELLQLERQFWQAVKDKDVEAALKLTDFPCIVAGSQGMGKVDREPFAKMMESAPYTLHEFELMDDDAEVRLLADDIAVLAYKVREKLTVDGKPVDLEASDTSVWIRRDGRWLCGLHTESLTGDPFGRDRDQQFKNTAA